MSAPIINDDMPRWTGQMPELLRLCRNFSTRADARSALDRMASLAELYAADHPAPDGLHTNIKELLRTGLQAHLGGDIRVFSTLLAIAGVADQYEVANKK